MAKRTRAAGGRTTKKAAGTAAKTASRTLTGKKAAKKTAKKTRTAAKAAKAAKRSAPKKTAPKKAAKTSAARKAPVKKAVVKKAARPAAKKAPVKARAAKKATARRTAPTPARPAPKTAVAKKTAKKAAPRRAARAPILPPIPSSLNVDQSAVARSGREELRSRLQGNREIGPAITAGDLDANWEVAYSSGDEAPGGDNPTPDQDVVDEIGHALGIEYEDNEELKGAAKLEERDRHRWELDPASAEDYPDHDK